MKHDFEIQYHEHGMTVGNAPGGGVPLSALEGIGALAKAHNASWDQVDGRLPRVLNVVLVIGSHASLDVWCAEIEAKLLEDEPDPVRRWWKGTTGGTSSRWLLSCLFDDHHRSGTNRPDWLPLDIPESYPADWSDFGRCVNLLDSARLRMRFGVELDRWIAGRAAARGPRERGWPALSEPKIEPAIKALRGKWPRFLTRWTDLEILWLRDQKVELSKLLTELRT